MNNMNNEEVFKIRAYGFGELAQLYFPYLSKRSASAQLRNWINRNPSFLEKLINSGFYKGRKLLTPMLVKQIIEVLGPP